jgi:hypothetical protein
MTLTCLLLGHADALLPSPGRLQVVCRHCGRTSSGLDIPAPRYRRTQPPKTDPTRLKRRLSRTYIAHRLEGAA